jgi:hypothetical protein
LGWAFGQQAFEEAEKLIDRPFGPPELVVVAIERLPIRIPFGGCGWSGVRCGYNMQRGRTRGL